MRSVIAAQAGAHDQFSIEMLLQNLVLSACDHGVEIDIDLQEDHIWIANIERHEGNAGSGARVLRDLMEISDHHDIPIRGRVVKNPIRLLNYYQSLGFRETDRKFNGAELNIEIEYEP